MNTQTDVQKQHEVGLGLFLGGLAVLILIGLLVSAYSRNPCAARPSLKGATSCNKECCARIRVVGDKTNAAELRRHVNKALLTLDTFEQKANERGATPATGLIVIGDHNDNKSRVQKTVDVCGVTTSIANRAALTASVNDARAKFIAFFESVTGEELAMAVIPPTPIVNHTGDVIVPTITSITQDQLVKCEERMIKYDQNKKKRAECERCALFQEAAANGFDVDKLIDPTPHSMKSPRNHRIDIRKTNGQPIVINRDLTTLLLVNSKQKPMIMVKSNADPEKHYIVTEERHTTLSGDTQPRWPDFVRTDKADQWRLDVDLLNPTVIMFHALWVVPQTPEANFSVEQHRFSMDGFLPVLAIKNGKCMRALDLDDYRAVEWTDMATFCQCTKATL